MCVCVIYASQDYRWRPLWAHIAEGGGYVTATRGPKTPQWNRTGSKCTKAPPSSTTQHTSARQNKLHHDPLPKNKLALPHNQPPASAHTQRFCWERRSKGPITHLVLFVFICLPYFIIQSEARLLTPPAPKTPPTESGQFSRSALMDGRPLFVLRLWFQKRKLPKQSRLSVSVHTVVALDKVFTVCMERTNSAVVMITYCARNKTGVYKLRS